jgi:Complex I intermediate-associated protein 30 (CIA30)
VPDRAKLCGPCALAHQHTALTQADQESAPESTYQAQFDTVSDEWTTVQLPWHEFIPVKRAQVLPLFHTGSECASWVFP